MSDYWEMIQRHEREMKLKEEAARLVARALLQKQEEEKKAAEWRCLQEAAARAAEKEAKRKRMEAIAEEILRSRRWRSARAHRVKSTWLAP